MLKKHEKVNMKTKIISLFSGGLDSILIVYLMQNLGFDVLPVCFSTPFFPPDKAIKIARENGFPLKIVDISEDYLPMLKSPKYGYGKNLNPCIDCHGLMLSKAHKIMLEEKAAFICSGEVVSQRPMSQMKNSLAAVDKISGIKDLIVRPLSQKLLPDTMPIRQGLVDKNDLLDISGRSRKAQLELAQKFHLPTIPSSGGGCLLTTKGYCQRLQDLLDFQMLDLEALTFLNRGRHFRIDKETKLVLGKNQGDNNFFAREGKGKLGIIAKNTASPLGLIFSKKEVSIATIELCGAILLKYCPKVESGQNHPIGWGKIGSDFALASAKKMSADKIERFRIN